MEGSQGLMGVGQVNTILPQVSAALATGEWQSQTAIAVYVGKLPNCPFVGLKMALRGSMWLMQMP